MRKAKRKEQLKKELSEKQMRSLKQRFARDTNASKIEEIDKIYSEWSRVAKLVSDAVWIAFLQNNQMPVGLKASGDVNSPLYVFPETKLVTSQKDCMLANALGTLKSWLSNLDNRFNDTFNKINRNNPDYAQLAHELCWINSNHLWRMSNEEQNQVLRIKQARQIAKEQAAHALKLLKLKKVKEHEQINGNSSHIEAHLQKKVSEYQLPENVLKLRKISSKATKYARRLYEEYMLWAKPPDSANQPLTVNVNSATRAAAVTSKFKHFSHWISIASLERNQRITIPLERNPYLEQRFKKGVPIKHTMSILKKEGFYEVQLSQEWTAEAMEYPPSKTEVLGIDLGLNTLLATSEGDLLGEGYLKQLYHLDAIYIKRLKTVQKQNKKPSEDLELQNIISRIREKIKSFIRFNIKKLIERRMPSVVRIENLDLMKKSENKLSKRLERLVRNFGQKIFNSTLEDLSFEFGFVIEKVASAYTSQTCNCCGFSFKANRSANKFKCLSCGYSGHADINAAKNISRRSGDERISTQDRRKSMWLRILRSWLEQKLELMQQFKTQPGVMSSIVANTLFGLKTIIDYNKTNARIDLRLRESIKSYFSNPNTEKLRTVIQLF